MRDDRRSERGSITFFGIGMVMILLLVGGLSIDLWHAFGERRNLAEMADAAAAAGANGIDAEVYRNHGVAVLDPDLAESYAWESLRSQVGQQSLSGSPQVTASDTAVVVEVRGEVDLMLLKVFSNGGPLEITVVAEAAPFRGAN